MAYLGAIKNMLTDFSIGTLGPDPNEEGVLKDHKLFEVSMVGIGNNKNAKLQQLVTNSIAEAKERGLDTSKLEKLFTNETESKKEAEMQDENIKKEEQPEEPAQEPQENKVDVEELVKNAVQEKVAGLESELKRYKDEFDKSAKEPDFTMANSSGSSYSISSVKNTLSNIDYRELHTQQIEFARQMLVNGNVEAGRKLNAINEFNLDRLKEEKVVRNSITIADMGNFVISPELLTEIQGVRTSYAPVVDNTEWRETLSTRMAWLERSGDINMQEVAACEDHDGSQANPNANLKPISEYGATLRTSDLSEVAAVTPVCNAATRFLAVDVLGDVAAGYRTDYDRKRAQLFIARLQQAVDYNGNVAVYDVSTPEEALISFLDTFGEISTTTPTGTYILSDKSLIELRKNLIMAGGSDVYNSVFFRGEGGVPTIDGKPYIVVPSDLLPTLGTSETKSFTVNGVTVTVDKAVFYLDLSNFTGRTSGGLQYDLATQASYETGGKVKSAFQRNEIVLRGSFFRGGAIKDREQVSALEAEATT
jgi:hypothetical protein